jgi:hypothetical protein
MSENDQVCNETSCETIKPIQQLKKRRDIFRFRSVDQDMAINLEHVFKIVHQDKRIIFEPANADPTKPVAAFIEFETEEAAKQAYEQIINVWASETPD